MNINKAGTYTDIYGNQATYDSNEKIIHYKATDGFEYWSDYDSNGKLIHCKDTDGLEEWYDSDGNKITKEQFDAIHSPAIDNIITIDGKQYKLTAI